MHQDNYYKSRLNFSTAIEIKEDNYWVVVTIEDRSIESYREQMPEIIRKRLQKEQSSIHIIRILAENLVLAKFYKDFILVELLKWQATQNEGGNYGT